MKKGRLLKLFSIITMAAAGVFGAVSFKSGKKNVNVDEPVAVKAEDHYYNTINIYYLPHDQWVQNGNERFKMNVFNGGTYKTYVEMSLYGTSSVPGPYYNRKMYFATCTYNDGWPSRIQFCRMSPDFSSEYNHSGQIYLTGDGATQVLMTNHDLNYWNDWTTDTSGVWLTPTVAQNAVYKTSDQSPSSSTGRVFFYNSCTHWASKPGCAVYAWGGSASPTIWSGKSQVSSATIYHLNWFTDDNGESYGYADIPTDITGYKFCTIKNADDVNSYFVTIDYFSDTSFIADSFAYVRYGLGSGNAISSGGAHGDVAGANLMKKVIEAYNTCSSSVLNGYGASDALNLNFYSHATAAAKSATHASMNGTTATIQTHFEAMASRKAGGRSSSANVLFPLLGIQNDKYLILIVVISIIGVTTIGGYFFYKKRKKN